MKSFAVRVPTILKFCLNCDSWKYHICERNDVIFRREGWQIEKVQMCIWNGLLDYCTASWYNSLGTMKRRLIAEQALLELFDKLWGQNNVICSRIGRFVKWCYDGPCRGFISWLFGLSACCVSLVGCAVYAFLHIEFFHLCHYIYIYIYISHICQARVQRRPLCQWVLSFSKEVVQSQGTIPGWMIYC
jgi:hypothetical protein